MLAIIGTYRKDAYVFKLLLSMQKHLTGVDQVAFVDDSGDDDWRELLGAWGSVYTPDGHGYGPAMRKTCEVGQQEPFALWLEEDFTFTSDVDAKQLQADLEAHPQWAQIVLQRQAWFPNEIRAGGMLEALAHEHEFDDVDGYLEHRAFFSGNPSIWRREIFASGWPDAKWSEDVKRDEVLAAGYRFAITPEQLVTHDGIRSGTGY